MCECARVGRKGKTTLTDHLHRSTTPLYRSLYFGPKRSPIQIFYLPKPTTSLNRPLKVGPTVGRFREVLLYLFIVVAPVFIPHEILYWEWRDLEGRRYAGEWRCEHRELHGVKNEPEGSTAHTIQCLVHKGQPLTLGCHFVGSIIRLMSILNENENNQHHAIDVSRGQLPSNLPNTRTRHNTQACKGVCLGVEGYCVFVCCFMS